MLEAVLNSYRNKKPTNTGKEKRVRPIQSSEKWYNIKQVFDFGGA